MSTILQLNKTTQQCLPVWQEGEAEQTIFRAVKVFCRILQLQMGVITHLSKLINYNTNTISKS